MCNNVSGNIQATKEAFYNALIEKGYPVESIITNWISQGIVADFAIVPTGSAYPIAIFEMKISVETAAIARGISTLHTLTEDIALGVTCMLVFPADTASNFAVMDVTEYVYRKKSLEKGLPTLDATGTQQLQKYSELINGAKAAAKLYNKNLKKRHNLQFKVFCWLVIPIISSSILILEWFAGYALTTNRLLVIGFAVIVALLPFSNKISIFDFVYETEKENDKQ